MGKVGSNAIDDMMVVTFFLELAEYEVYASCLLAYGATGLRAWTPTHPGDERKKIIIPSPKIHHVRWYSTVTIGNRILCGGFLPWTRTESKGGLKNILKKNRKKSNKKRKEQRGQLKFRKPHHFLGPPGPVGTLGGPQ